MTPRQFYCETCGGLFNQVGRGRPRRYCDDCKGNPLPKTIVTICGEVIPGRIERTITTQEQLDLALRIVRDVAAGRPCHQAALDLMRRIGG